MSALAEEESSPPLELPTTCKLPEVRDELQRRVAVDQKARKAIPVSTDPNGNVAPKTQAMIDRLVEIDKDNTKWLKKQIDEHGWLGKSLVGRKGARNAWLLVQHADFDRKFQERCLKLMRERPKDEVRQQDIAYLTDRVLVGQGKLQRYGTQVDFDSATGKATLKPTEKVDELNDRRAQVNLAPIEDYLRMIEQWAKSKADDQSPPQ